MISLPTITYCPATMCPLFARGGSPWTDEKNHKCDKSECGWWDEQCIAASWALEGLFESASDRPPKAFDCQRASECQWQVDSIPRLCPPRQALADGKDPADCAY